MLWATFAASICYDLGRREEAASMEEQTKNVGGRPRKNTPEMVRNAVDKMIAEYEETLDISKLHDIRLMQILGNVKATTIESYYLGDADKHLKEEEKNSTKGGYRDALKKLIAYRQAVCVKNIAESRTPAGWIFLSKQPHWGGFQDVQKQERSGTQEFKVTICGPDGKPLK